MLSLSLVIEKGKERMLLFVAVFPGFVLFFLSQRRIVGLGFVELGKV